LIHQRKAAEIENADDPALRVRKNRVDALKNHHDFANVR
jgi:hypothetical protein